MTPSSTPVILLELGAEGGSLTLRGRKKPGTGAWEFSRRVVDAAESLVEDDAPVRTTETSWTSDWNAALATLDRYPWAMLYPLKVHADFAERLRAAAEQRLAKAEGPQAERVRERWTRVEVISPRPQATIFRNAAQPDWGMGVVAEPHPKNWILLFEHAGRKVFNKAASKTLVQESVDAAVFTELEAKLKGRRVVKPKTAAKATKTRGSRPVGAKARFASFDEQVKVFETLFPGGFVGESFSADERGVADETEAADYKEAAIALIRESLSRARFKDDSPDDLFAAAKRVVGATNIAYPMEGSIPFGAIPKLERAGVVAALEQLLHGSAEYPKRVEVFASAVNLRGADGAPKKVTWPLATLFGALADPKENVCVKPKYFAEQAALFDRAVAASQPVTAAGYRIFLEVAKEAQRRLLAAGHQPRDLMDVYTFIWRTHKEKSE